ncbi:ROK family protein [Ruminiclostridium cellulolyticum]|uniref:ROK family protein n=1 Tax=Ruminiclostridium cellulolyticum (strain ATCC 35319 / DSM 5812 / JCM 6584 / H10) TaxID=394503 RepID=B8I2M1_RUMCH|nr:ROK family protein [Ruminiclostridium cellulolyticum]ACL76014.1 ROK family protein [Ruminiclostridium cellulolyticum H10]
MALKNVNLIKQINLDKVRRVIKENKKATKPQLANLTGLSVVTINSLVELLLGNGEILVDELEVSSGGRPATIYSFNEEYSMALVIYTNEYEMKDLTHIAVVNLYGEVIEVNKIALDEISEYSFDLTIDKMLKKYPNIKLIGIGMPGQEIRGKMENSDYISLEGKAFVEHLRKQFQIPVVFENDVNAAVLGYCISNQCEDKNVIGIYIPEKYPLGVGIFINGNMYKGKDGFAGEAKFLPDEFDWNNPTFVSENISVALKKLILTFTCLLNPDILVIYRENLTRLSIDPIIEDCKKILKSEVMPDVVVSNIFGEDFAEGIKQISLKPFEPKWQR